MAPEIINGEEHNHMVDFWSLGVIAFEFIRGRLPFNDETAEKVFKKIVNKEMVWTRPGTDEEELSPAAFDFIDKLL